jgi:alkyl hydroperoxide reductase subunit F
MYDLIIIGGGPAGCAAAVYAARKQLNTLIITPHFGGQSGVSPEIFNWIGTPSISGAQLDADLEKHVREYEGEYLDIASGYPVTNLEHADGVFTVQTEKESYTSKTALIVSGSSRRKLGIPGADEFENKGVVYCASCDGPLFANQDVVVVGGGNAGFESAAQLLAYCKSVTLIHRSAQYKADEITVQKVLSKENMIALLNTEPIEVLGDKFVSGVKVKNKETGEESTIDATGIFVEIGQIPNTHYVPEGLIDMTPTKQVVIDPRTQRSSLPGLWAAGDVSDVLYHQNNIAAGDAVRALEDIYLYIHTGK